VLKSTTDFDFMNIENQTILTDILTQIDLITPNYIEIKKLFPDFNFLSNTPPFGVGGLLLKGGHNPKEIGVDYLYTGNQTYTFTPNTETVYEKHGSGCVLSAAITARIALGETLPNACAQSKLYTETYLQSCLTKLGYHYV